jgi:hypothetical protein
MFCQQNCFVNRQEKSSVDNKKRDMREGFNIFEILIHEKAERQACFWYALSGVIDLTISAAITSPKIGGTRLHRKSKQN